MSSTHVYIASHPNQVAEARDFVSARYQSVGYGQKHGFAVHPVVAIIARRGAELIATLSVYPDCPSDMPLAAAFPEVAGLRAQGLLLAEIGSLAAQPGTGLLSGDSPVFERMVSLGVRYHYGRGGNTIVVAVNPKHQEFYETRFGFKEFGSVRPYLAVQGYPAVGLIVSRGDLLSAYPNILDLGNDHV